MEVETLEVRGLAYRPDLVVLGFCPNDASLPSFILAQRDVLSLRESFFADFVRGRFQPLPGGDALAPSLAGATAAAWRTTPRWCRPPIARSSVGGLSSTPCVGSGAWRKCTASAFSS